MRDSFLQGTSQLIVTSRPSFDSMSVEHSSKPSAASISASGYDGLRGEETSDDEDHDSRRVGLSVGAIGKPYRGRRQRMTPYNEDSLLANFESMSIETQFNDSSNEANIYSLYAMSCGQLPPNLSSSIDGEYERCNYPSSTQMLYYLPYEMQQQEFQMSTWENLGFPIHGQVVGRTQEIYA
ncbi:hypothetical protein CK203_098548 [Vitis vinifera]|uniref:Uncharacterized protein n=1 Tax=Vitis vinifera TaxID=29760 RepID=A0A438BMD7_VITVI|nr:hypothetical protein CK203_098548 [Vitis vinifera]